MNDFDYDALQKKRIAAGARHMKRGSRSKRCSLPSDNLTPAQLKRRNGPVSTYKLDAPMRWDDFKAMPVDLQKKYVDSLHKNYGATGRMIAKMLGVSVATFDKTKRTLGVNWQGDNYRRSEAEIKERGQMWAAFCNGVVGGGDAVKETPREPEKVETLPVRCPDELEEVAITPVTVAQEERRYKPPEPMYISELTATFVGGFSAEAFLGWISKLPIPEAEVEIRVSVTKRGEAV